MITLVIFQVSVQNATTLEHQPIFLYGCGTKQASFLQDS